MTKTKKTWLSQLIQAGESLPGVKNPDEIFGHLHRHLSITPFDEFEVLSWLGTRAARRIQRPTFFGDPNSGRIDLTLFRHTSLPFEIDLRIDFQHGARVENQLSDLGFFVLKGEVAHIPYTFESTHESGRLQWGKLVPQPSHCFSAGDCYQKRGTLDKIQHLTSPTFLLIPKIRPTADDTREVSSWHAPSPELLLRCRKDDFRLANRRTLLFKTLSTHRSESVEKQLTEMLSQSHGPVAILTLLFCHQFNIARPSLQFGLSHHSHSPEWKNRLRRVWDYQDFEHKFFSLRQNMPAQTRRWLLYLKTYGFGKAFLRALDRNSPHLFIARELREMSSTVEPHPTLSQLIRVICERPSAPTLEELNRYVQPELQSGLSAADKTILFWLDFQNLGQLWGSPTETRAQGSPSKNSSVDVPQVS